MNPNKPSQMTKSSPKAFAELGYSAMDTAEIILLLNRILSNYAVYQQKLRNFYWNVTGHDFFELHQQFEQMYERSIEEIDKLAKRIRLFGQHPHSTFEEYLKHATIIEASTQVPSFQMAQMILHDIRILLELMEKGIDAAMELNDNGTRFMLQSFIFHMEKEHWMLTAWSKQDT
jgi:starvation-inducible DNA-binding protein